MTTMSKIEPGLEARYHVARLHDTEGKHDDCPFFVLDPKHDPTAIEALRTYSRKTPNPRLADDLDALVEKFAAPTAADQPTTEPSAEQVKAAARTLNLNGWTCDGGSDEPGRYDECEDCQRCCDGLARAALRSAAELGAWGRRIASDQAPAPQPAAAAETEGVRHFAPWGTYRASCGVTVPPGEAPESSGFTYRRHDTTCPDCRSRFTSPADTETEVQWGVRRPGGTIADCDDKRSAQEYVRLWGGTLVSIREEA